MYVYISTIDGMISLTFLNFLSLVLVMTYINVLSLGFKNYINLIFSI